MAKECLQMATPVGTPCFEIDAKRTVCPLDYCPAARHLDENPTVRLWDALHTYCVMSDTYCGTDGRGLFIATIARLAQNRELKPQ